MTLRVALFGAGVMGQNHARLLGQSERAVLDVIVDPDTERAAKLAADSGARVGTIDEAARCAAAIIASPTDSHVSLALSLLEGGTPVLIEKPVAVSESDVRAVIDRAESVGMPVMCGFVERFNPAITTALEMLDEAPHHITAVRHSPPTPRATTSVVWDLLIHDIDLTYRFVNPSSPRVVHAVRWSPGPGAVEELVDCSLLLNDGAVATLSSSRASQRKIRRVSIATASRLIEIDLLRADVTVYRHVRQQHTTGQEASYRAETIVDIPFVRHGGEPLALQLDHFLDLISGTGDPEAERGSILLPHQVASQVAGSPA